MKLSELAANETPFEIVSFHGYMWQKWNDAEKKFEKSKEYKEGMQKSYSLKVKVDDGEDWLNLTEGQMKSVLLSTLKDGVATLVGSNFTVKSNGKEGIDIRYYFNPVKNDDGLPF